MAEELKFAVKCRPSTRRPVFKRRCSPCLMNQGLSYSTPGIFVPPGHQSAPSARANSCSHTHRIGLPPLDTTYPTPPAIHSANSSPSAQTKMCNHNLHHHLHQYHNNLGPNVLNLPSSFNYTECHSPSLNTHLYLNRSKSVGAPPIIDDENQQYSTRDHFQQYHLHRRHNDYNLETDSCN